MGNDTNQRGSGIAVVLVVVLLLGFFVFLCAGIGAVMLLFRARSNSATPVMGSAGFPGSTSPYYPSGTEGLEDMEFERETVLYLNSAGEVNLKGESVPLESLGDRVDREAMRRRTDYLVLRVVAAPDCPAETLVTVLKEVWNSEYCSFDIPSLQVATPEEEAARDKTSKAGVSEANTEEGAASEDEAAAQEPSDKAVLDDGTTVKEASEKEASEKEATVKEATEEVDPAPTDGTAEG